MHFYVKILTPSGLFDKCNTKKILIQPFDVLKFLRTINFIKTHKKPLYLTHLLWSSFRNT